MPFRFPILKIGQISHIVVVGFSKNARIHRGSPQDLFNSKNPERLPENLI